MPTTLTAAPRMKLDGAEVKDLVNVLGLLRVHRSIDAAAYVQLRLDDTDATAGFTVGKELAIDVVSEEGGETPVFSGVIASVGLELEPGRNELIVEAYDNSFKLGQRTVITTHKNKSASEIIQQIARDAGMTSEVSSELAKYKYEHVNQWGTIHRFLSQLCLTAGCEWWVD